MAARIVAPGDEHVLTGRVHDSEHEAIESEEPRELEASELLIIRPDERTRLGEGVREEAPYAVAYSFVVPGGDNLDGTEHVLELESRRRLGCTEWCAPCCRAGDDVR